MKRSHVMGSLSLVLLLSHILVVSFTLTAAQKCHTSNTGNFTTNSTYGQNRNDILLSLSSNITVTNGGFYTATLGQGSDKVYAIALCGGEVKVSVETCKNCVASTAQTIINTCPNEKEAIKWADGGVPMCVVRYSNRSIFGVKEVNPYLVLYAIANISKNMNGIDEIWTSFMSTIVTEAAMGSSKLKFASKEKNLTGSEKIYAWGQCTPDLSQSDCRECLQECLSYFRSCCIGHGGIIYRPSCMMRSESYPIYDEFTASSSPAPPPSTNTLTSGGNSSRRIIIIVVATVISVVISSTFCFCFIRWKARKKYEGIKEENVENEITTVQSLQFELGTIEAATNNFSADNKIGEGGFGSVYKGTLSNGQEIAVKRLSRCSRQGAQEFKNEVVLVAKLQHRNLVRLLGFCVGGEEKILIYEFVPNRSLDYFLFDPEKQAQLDWLRRYKIIGGIVRGMLYLHEDSRLRIIHRDLKASNVLLDGNMDPKISDFGLARIVGVDQTRGSTNRIAGTYGYMSPEYVIRGHFSTKSDVFSFGVLVLEIISGKKNNSFYQSNYAEDLLSYAWKHWRDGTPLELMDPTLTQSYSRNEVIRCIQIGLLCVQQDPADRPTMASIVLMLDSYLVSLPLPQQPAFFAHSKTESYMTVRELKSDQSTSKSVPSSVNEASITELYPR